MSEKTSKNLILDEHEIDVLIKQILNIGEAMYFAGGEISRIEDTMHRVGKAYGADHVSIYAITSDIVVTIEFDGFDAITQSRRIKRDAIDLTKLERLNSLSRRCTEDPLPINELKKEVLKILDEKPNKTAMFIGQMLAAAMFAVFFGGDFIDAIGAGIGAALIWLLQIYLKPLCSGTVFFNFFASVIVTSVICIICSLIPGLHEDMILIGDIMVIVPGIAITDSIRFTISGDSISGIEKLIAAILQASGIAAGVTLAMYIF